MSRQLAAVLLLTSSLPIGVSPPKMGRTLHPYDEPGGRASLAAGGGEYDIFELLSSCQAESTFRTHVSHVDIAAQVEYESRSGGYVAGVRGGVLDQSIGEWIANGVPFGPGDTRRLGYLNPYVAREGRMIGLGVGGVLATEDFLQSGLQTGKQPVSGHIRGGWRDGPCLVLRYMEGTPLAGAGGYGDLGIDFPLGRRGAAWIGAGFDNPSELDTRAIRARVRLLPALVLIGGGFLASRSGTDGRDVRTSGWHVGLEWRQARAGTGSARAN
jgi:hypothetical protein